MTNAIILAVVIAIIATPLLFLKVVQPWLRRCSTCGGKTYPGGTMDAGAWYLGPRLKWGAFFGKEGGNKSRGMPAHPIAHPEGWFLDFPVGTNLPLGTGDKMDYATYRNGPLAGRKTMRIKYRLDLAPGASVYAVPEVDQAGQMPARITPYFQRVGDDWTTQGKYEAYRWYFTETIFYLKPDVNEIEVSFDHGWTATQTSNQVDQKAEFDAAMANAGCVGFVFGGNEKGVGHGARATGAARFTLLEFSVS